MEKKRKVNENTGGKKKTVHIGRTKTGGWKNP